jgi:iron complex transport system permease protein
LNYKEQGLSSFCYQCFGRGITAFCCAFIGLAVPHIAKLVFRPVTTLYYFGYFASINDSISQVPGGDITLPINAVTSVFGAIVMVAS